ncbi:hypothetical protein ACFVIM_00005 [Streptomyces sp. NPDC057638]|uniref:hypothetical protein n=1 Tax=Streptomyces sp. NPDC057638 TaxID=3346190 RepID=UPI0036A1FCBD
MRAICAASAALLGSAALALTAPPAVAADTADTRATALFTVSPSTVAAGGRVALSASGCATTATASSAVFDAVTIRPGTSTVATVDADARPGAQYSVQFTCGSQRGSFNLSIAGSGTTPTISSTAAVRPAVTVTPSPTRSATPTATATPRGVRGGLGGTSDGTNSVTTLAGGAMVVVATAATVVVLRRRAGDRRH